MTTQSQEPKKKGDENFKKEKQKVTSVWPPMADIERLLDECGKGDEGVDWPYLFSLDLTQRTEEFYESLHDTCQVK